MGDVFHESLRLRDRIDQARLDLIRTDLEVLFTFATIVEMEYRMDNREHAARTLAEAEKGYFTLLRLFSHAKGLTAELEEEFQSKFKHLRERLDGLQRSG